MKKNPGEMLAPLKFLRDLGYQFFIPTFVSKNNGESFLSSYGSKINQNLKNLALVPLVLEHRVLYQQQLNIFACHPSKLPNQEAGQF